MSKSMTFTTKTIKAANAFSTALEMQSNIWREKDMYIEGIGKVSKEKVSKILTREALEAIAEGEMTWEEAGNAYKYREVSRLSEIGQNGDLFAANYNRIPDKLKQELTTKDLAELVMAFYQCYGDGKAAGKEE